MSNPEYWAFIIPWNIIIISLAIGWHCYNNGWEPPQWLSAIWEHIVRFMEKPFRRKKPAYEPAGIIHYGKAHLVINDTLYQVYNQPNGKCEIWAWEECLGEHERDQAINTIINHAKGQK